jgi:NAD+ synthase (glutamine-hydrolysing)
VGAGRGFDEDLVICEVDAGERMPRALTEGDPLLSASDEQLVCGALVLGVRDYCRKVGFKSAVLGLSGGIDSAVCAVIAAAALGPAAVHGVSLPSRYSSEGSLTDARELAARLGIVYSTIAIEEPVAALERTLAAPFAGRGPDVTEENMQSRVRGTILMALSNKFGHILLTTGNKSELAVGYCTLYGDMNGGLAVLSDLGKMWVYRLARWMNENPDLLGIAGLKGPPIPAASITKPPSAELRPNQTDQDSLPPYEVLDEVIERYVEKRQSGERIVEETGLDAAMVKRVLRLIDVSEFKRQQAAIGLKVTGVAFGTGRRWPVVQRYSPTA